MTMKSLDPERLARRQLERDRARTATFPKLGARKRARMCASPFAFLRGAAPLFYEVLEHDDTLASGPPGKGWICGDAHLENFGAYRPDALAHEEGAGGGRSRLPKAVFHLNDFDEAVRAPLRLDVLRLTTSLVLALRERGAGSAQVLDCCRGLLEMHARTTFEAAAVPDAPAPVKALVAAAAARSRPAFLAARTTGQGQRRRFIRGDRYFPLPKKLGPAARRAFAAYAKRLDAAEGLGTEQAEVIDLAFRVAGTGSLGTLRVAVLVAGKGGRDGQWIFDMKAQDEPAAAAFGSTDGLPPAERVARAITACLARSPRMVGTTKLDGRSMFVRRLVPQEDKLDLAHLALADFAPLARHLGALLGEAHRTGAPDLDGRHARRWSERDREHLLGNAIRLASLHEAAWLFYERLASA
jgi:uncharacterized protein (DUF2252 family)